MGNADSRPRRRRIADALCLSALAFSLYLLLGQRTLYGDAMTFLLMLRDGVTTYERHVLYPPALYAWHSMLRPFGVSPYQSALLLSQVGGALSVGLLYLAARGYGLSRTVGWITASAFALCPASIFFATVVELHGPFMAPMALAWVLGARLARRPSIIAAIAVGLATALATAMHSSGAVLPAPILGAVLLEAWPGRACIGLAQRLRLTLLAGIVHTVLLLTLTGGMGQFAFVQKMAPVSVSLQGNVPAVLTWEWLWPFLPFSVLFAVGVWRATWRRLSVVVLLSLPLYLVPSFLVLAMWREYGAYLIPLAFPAIAIVVGVLPRGLSLVATLASAIVGIVHVVRFDHAERPRAYAAGVHELAGIRPTYLLGGDTDDIEAFFVALPKARLLLLTMPPFLDPALGAPALAGLDAYLDAALRHDAVVLLTAGTEVALRHPQTLQVYPAASAIVPHLEARYALTPVNAHGFAGRQLRLR